MAEARPYVINANVVKLLNSAPIVNMRPSLGSLVQRKTVDIGCYPFPFMVNEDNVPLDGRTIVSNGAPVKLPIRIVPFWCSENTYSRYPGDSSFNNGKISWAGNKGYVKSNIEGNNLNLEPIFLYDQSLGVTYTQVRYNTAFISMDNTVPKEWLDIKNSVFAPNGFDEVRFTEGTTFEIGNNVLFKAWAGLTVALVELGGFEDNTYGFLPMSDYNSGGGTYSPFFDRYNYECLDQILNSDRFLTVGIEPKTFWEGIGASYGASGGLTGQLFLLNAFTGGANAGSYFILSVEDALLDTYLYKGVSGATISGKDLAKNLYGIANENPYLGINEKIGTNGNNAGFIETMAFLLGTNQKFATLSGTGGTASLRALDFNNPCSASFVYDETTELGRWGYEVQPLSVGEDIFVPGVEEVGCNVNTFVEYLSGATAKDHGLVHPLSWMFWRGISSGNSIVRYAQGFMHDYVGDNEIGEPIYNKLEGIHDYLCYEHFDNNGLLDRVYYPLRPITNQWYSQKVAPAYTQDVEGQIDAQQFGSVLDLKSDTAFTDAFKGPGSVGAISLRSLQTNGFISINFDSVATSLNGVTGILFPYFVPLASFAMQGINTNFPGSVNISGEFSRFDGAWTKSLFSIPEDGSGESTTLKQVYQYYAEGVSSGADFGIGDNGSPISPFNKDIGGSPNFRLFSWNALTKISPFDLQSNVQKLVRSSFSAISQDRYGKAEFSDPNIPNRLLLNGADVDVDPLNYPPTALPNTEFGGLTYETLDGTATVIANLGCGSYINVVRYANNTAPNETTIGDAFGLTAQRELISDVVLGASKKTFLEFDPAKESETANPSDNFSRTDTPIANNNSNFFHQTPGGFSNFFFTTPTDDSSLAVFENPYYLNAADYFTKYGGNGGANQDIIWWENTDIGGLAVESGFVLSGEEALGVEAFAVDLTGRLINNAGELWVPEFGFRSSGYDFTQTENQDGLVIPGVRQALADGLHPAFIYRLFSTNVIENLGFDVETSCLQTWRSDGIPCDKLPLLIEGLQTNGGIYNSYFSGLFGCSQVGEEFPTSEFDLKKGKDFFGRCAIRVVGGGGGAPGGGGGTEEFEFAYTDYFYSPFPKILTNPFFVFQNQSCDGAGAITDPPVGAALTPFGLQFADALAIAENQTIDFNNPLEVRDVLFAYTGNTASDNGIDGRVPSVPRVGAWLQDKLSSIFEYWNTHRTDGDTNLAKVETVLFTLYPTLFQAYKDSFNNSTTFRVWAVKPKCVGEWTPECSDLAHRLRNEVTWRSASLAPRNFVFRDEEVNAGADPTRRIISPPYGYDVTPGGNISTPLTTSNIISENEGFLSSIKTIFIEPLGLATNVLASEAQTVPRATISSTVLGKLTTIIDSSGFLRDVNEIIFESGFGMKILGDNTTGNISFSVTGLTLGSLEDVAVTGATSGDILVFDGDSGKWINRPFADVVQPFLAGFTGFTGSFEPGTNFFYQDSAPDAGVTIGSRWMDSNTGIEYIYINDGDTDLWIQSSVDATVETPRFVYETVLVTGSTYQAFDTDYYIGVSYAGAVTITLPSDPDEGKTVVVKDASGFASYPIRAITVVGAEATDTIDNAESAIININNGSLQFIYKDGWRII